MPGEKRDGITFQATAASPAFFFLLPFVGTRDPLRDHHQHLYDDDSLLSGIIHNHVF